MSPPTADNRDIARRSARISLVFSISLIAGGYASAFLPGGTPPWAPWLLAVGIPGSLCAIMVMGAARAGRGIGKLKIPFLFVFIVLVAGFSLALGLPANEGAGSFLLLGLPLRAAIVVYGIGLLPIVVLPVAYAITFDTQTLNDADIARVRELGVARRAAEKLLGRSEA